jgi:hypothetical protein
MAEAPSFRISTRSIASSRTEERSLNIFWKSSARG